MDNKNDELTPLVDENDDKENQKRLYTRSNSQESKTSLLSVAEINRKRRQTMHVLYFTMFIGSISFSIVMASVWPFLRRLDANVSETFLGWVNAGYSLAQMIASFGMGYWSEKRKAIEPIVVSILFLAIGSGLYSYAESFGAKGIWVILGARVLLGLSAGSIAVTRAVAAQLSTNDDRAKVMAYLALWQATGFSIGPALQALSKPLGTKGLIYKPLKLYLNVYTAPGFAMILLSIINAVLVIIYFVDDVDDSKSKSRKKLRNLRIRSISFEPIDRGMIIVCNILWFSLMSVFALNETIITPVVMNEYGWSRPKTVFYTSIILSVAGIIAVFIFMGIAPLSKRFGERILSLTGYLIMLSGFIIYLPWGPGYPKLRNPSNSTVTVNGNAVALLNQLASSKSDDGGGGCPYQYKWCHTTPQLAFGQFLTGATLVGIGYPLSSVVVSTLYSKIIGPYPQGQYMGLFSAVGSLARVVGPLYVTAIYQHFGMRWTATSVDIFLILTVILFLVNWRRLVPYGVYKKSNQLISINQEEP